MRRFALLLAVALGLAACGGSDSPSVSQVTVTVREAGAVRPNASVVMSSGIDETGFMPVPTGVLATQSTNASGQTVFTVPASTSTGSLCFSWSTNSGTAFVLDCATLNALSPTVLLELSP